ncbi:Chek2, partial [Symbiodinium sp. KB8]
NLSGDGDEKSMLAALDMQTPLYYLGGAHRGAAEALLLEAPAEGHKKTPGRDAFELALNSIFQLIEMLKSQVAIAGSLQMANIAVRHVDRELAEATSSAYEQARDLFKKAADVVSRYADVAKQVSEHVLPDLQLAVEEQEPAMAADMLEMVKEWVAAMKKDSDLIRSNYGELQSAVLTLVDRTSRSKQAADDKLAAAVATAKEAQIAKATQNQTHGSGDPSSASCGFPDEQIEKPYQVATRTSPDVSPQVKTHVAAEVDSLIEVTDESIQLQSSVTTTPQLTSSEYMALVPYKDSLFPEAEGAAGHAADSSKSLLKALHELRRVDSILEGCSVFWAGMDRAVHQLGQMKQHAERLVNFATSTPKLRERFDQRMLQYGKNWSDLEKLCREYNSKHHDSGLHTASQATTVPASLAAYRRKRCRHVQGSAQYAPPQFDILVEVQQVDEGHLGPGPTTTPRCPSPLAARRQVCQIGADYAEQNPLRGETSTCLGACGSTLHAPVIWACSSPAKGALLEAFCQQHMRCYFTETLLNLGSDINRQEGHEIGSTPGAVEDSEKGAGMTVGQITSGKSTLARELAKKQSGGSQTLLKQEENAKMRDAVRDLFLRADLEATHFQADPSGEELSVSLGAQDRDVAFKGVSAVGRWQMLLEELSHSNSACLRSGVVIPTAPSASISLMSELSSEEEAALAKIQAAAKGADVRMAAAAGESQAGKEAEMSPEEKDALLKIQAAQRGVETRVAEDKPPVAHMMMPKKRQQRRKLRSARMYRLMYDFKAKKLNFLKGSDWDRKGSVPFLTLVGPVSSQCGLNHARSCTLPEDPRWGRRSKEEQTKGFTFKETLSNLPPQLAERLKSLYAKCERLKQAKEKTDTPESGSPALAVEERSEHNVIMDGKESLDLAHSMPESGSEGEEGVELEDIVDTAEASLPCDSAGMAALLVPVCEASALLGRDGWDGLAENVDRFDPYLLEAADGEEDAEEVEEDWTDLPVGTTFDADGADAHLLIEGCWTSFKSVQVTYSCHSFGLASYSVARKLGQSQGIITYAVNCKGASTWIRLVLLVFTCKGENYVAKLAANGPEAAARRNSGEAADANVVLQNDVFDVSSFVKTLAEVMADFGVSQLAAPAPAAAAKRAAPASQFHEPGKPEEPSPEKVKYSSGLYAAYGIHCGAIRYCCQAELAELLAPAFAKFPCVVPPPRKGEGSSPERSPPVGQEPASEVWYKAPPPKKTLSSMLSSYEEEEEPLEPEAELRVRLTSDAARVRAAQRRGRAEVRPVLEEAPSIEDIRAAILLLVQLPAKQADGVEHSGAEGSGLLPGSVWDPATGQFVSEPIPDDILQSFKKEKDLKLEDYQERVLMAQLAEKKRRLEPLC